MNIIYRVGIIPTAEEIIELYNNAELPRPTDDKDRIAKMYQHSNLVVSASDYNQLVGVSRSITDWNWSCYLSDLAVRINYQKFGIGKKLI